MGGGGKGQWEYWSGIVRYVCMMAWGGVIVFSGEWRLQRFFHIERETGLR